ncbi:hypothetical protein AVEN_62688-1 [Araneus ventricosus]|uniref:Uncharacterized protein n=1 Tax=Araneus ventricosus TaxID=182803 RepID=A0A4Y2FLQ1_ARAVE|nr:hypothetical protein AVEN_62688-1 [Araneus ventricosus]
MRDVWNRMLMSLPNSSGFSKDDIARFLGKIVACCPLIGERAIKSMVKIYLALCNEVIMFFLCEGIDVCLNTVIDAASMEILYLFVFHDLNVSETIEKLFDDFSDISSYSERITDFIIPRDSKKVATDRFEKEDEKRYNDAVEKASFPEKTRIKKLTNHLGFLPHELYSAIALEESIDLPENLVLASDLPGDRESPEPPTLPARSASRAVGRSNWDRRKSTRSGNVSQQAAQGGQRDNNSSELEIEDDLGRMTLDAEGVSRGSQERYQSRRSKRKNKRKIYRKRK